MAESKPPHGNAVGTDRTLLRHAFRLLATAELGHWPLWNGPDDGLQLRMRVELLAVLLDIVPRSELHRLDAVAESWESQFPDQQTVSSAQLRASARAILNLPSEPSVALHRESASLRRAVAVTRCRLDLGEGLSLAQSALDFSAPQAERQCALGLSVWFDHLANQQRWRCLAAVIPGEAPAAIDKVYVELFAISDQAIAERTGESLAGRERLSRRLLASEYPVVSVPTMVARTLYSCVVIGEPGSGKSTLIQWLAWATNKEQIRDFDAALVVKLSAFAAALAVKPQLSLLEFFFECLGTKIDDWRPASYWLRRVASESQRFLLLLDGWDEVPATHRGRVRERIQNEGPYFVTVITSRPSGLPGQLGDGQRADYYHIAGLAPGAVDTLTQNLLSSLGKPDLLEQILERIRSEPDLREMAANPFLLGLLVRVLTRTAGEGAAPRTLADVYQQTVTWI